LKISISALKIELDSDDGMRSCDTSQRTIHETTHGRKNTITKTRAKQAQQRGNGSQRQTRETQEQGKGQTMKETEQKPQKDDLAQNQPKQNKHEQNKTNIQ
jgi:hypothetical protein